MADCDAKTRTGGSCKIPAVEGEKYCHVHLRQRRNRKLAVFSTLLSVILIVMGFVADVTGIVSFFGDESPQPVSTPTISIPTATPDEILILITDFKQMGTKSYDVSGRIYEALKRDIGGGRFPHVSIRRIPVSFSIVDGVPNSTVLGTLAHDYNARVIIWGFYDDAGFSPAFNLGRAMPLSLEPEKTEKRRWEVHTVDYPIAQLLGIAPESGDGVSPIMGPQNRLAEYPAEEKVQAYIREALPKQMTFLSARILSFLLEEPHDLEALDLAVEVGEEITALDFLANADYWRKLLAQAYLDRIRLKGDSQDLNQAMVGFNRAIELDSTDALTFYNRGVTYGYLGNLERAIQDYTKAVDLDPDFASAYLNRGNAYYNTGDLHQAILDLTKAIEIDPEHVGAYVIRGAVYYSSGDLERAIRDFTKAIELDPSQADAYNNRGEAYRRAGDLERAIKDYTEAVKIDPGLIVSYRNRGVAYFTYGDLEQAIRDFTKTIELDPNNALNYYYRANAFYKLDNLNQALLDYTKAIELDPEFSAAFFDRGIVYAESGDLDRSIQDFSRAIESDPENALAYFNRGIAYGKLGDYIPAIADLEKYLELDPSASNREMVFDIIEQLRSEVEE